MLILDVCALLFDNDLRNECATGQWEELFYYNPRFKVRLLNENQKITKMAQF